MLERYQGKGSWAVVTGSSDGIGAEYAKLLAKLGFNICLVSRTWKKLEKIAGEIKRDYPKVETKIVVADFTGDTSLSFYKGILNKVKDLDISIVIANAGLLVCSDIQIASNGNLISGMIDVNVMHYVMMHKIFLPKLLERTKQDKRCAVIGVSSATWLRYMPAPFHVYSATKALATYLSKGFIEEIRELGDQKMKDGSQPNLIDIQCQSPSATRTNLVQHWAMTFFTPAEYVTTTCLRDLGQHDIVYGTAKNELEANIVFKFIFENFSTILNFAMRLAGSVIAH